MAKFLYSQLTPPDATAYDASYPTRSTELYSNECHQILATMSSNGFLFDDGIPEGADRDNILANIRDMVSDVTVYATAAITNFRDHGSPDLLPPDENTITLPLISYYREPQQLLLSLYAKSISVCWTLYYLWCTEEDPLRIKDYIRDMLLAYPLNDLTIALNEEGGSSIRIFPSWNEIEAP